MPPHRRFTPTDAALLLVAASLGVWAGRVRLARWALADDFEVVSASQRLYLASMFLGMIAAAAAPAVLLIRLRRPRPPWREIVRQPGSLACLAATLAGANHLGREAWRAIPPRTRMLFASPEFCLSFLDPRIVAPAVVLAWVVLATSGGGHAERGWVDRLGRGLGLALVLLYGLHVVSIYVM